MQIAGIPLRNNLFMAPMAGVTDRPFRQLAKRMGVGLAVSEMVTANNLLYGTKKTQQRIDHSGEPGPISVQIAGAEPEMMAEAARYNVANGAQIIDINMGCPAKKVCNIAAGSALMQNEKLVARILKAVVTAVPETPVTLKCRTGWDRANKNVFNIADIAEAEGIRLLSVHGRTRADQYRGEAEYDTIAELKTRLRIPLIANGDIDSAEKAAQVLAYTGADGIMIGRAAQGRPWIFREISHYLATGKHCPPPLVNEIKTTCLAHLQDLYEFYGEWSGLRIARKHIGWYTKNIAGAATFRKEMVLIEDNQLQIDIIHRFFDALGATNSRISYEELAA